MTTPKIFVLSGSTRSGSFNNRLVDGVVRELISLDCEVTRISLADYDLPIYNGDLEVEKGIPDNALKLARILHEHDGFFIVSPEYNGSLPPLLKNTIDWISRVKADNQGEITPYRGKVCALGAASPGVTGGMAMLVHLRDVLFRLGVLVIAEPVNVGNAGSAFDDDGKLSNERTEGFLKSTCKSLVEKATLLNR